MSLPLPEPATATSPAAEDPAAAKLPEARLPQLSVHFVPRWPKNPYHAELARHLANHAVCVGEESRLKEILRGARRSGRWPEIVHLHALPAFSFRPERLARLLAFWWRLRRLRRAGVKLVWTVHNIADHESPHPAIDRVLLRASYRFMDAVILHSPAARELVESQWRVRRQRDVFIVHHGHFIDCYPAVVTRPDARRRLGVVDDALVFLFLGNIRPYKGVQNLIAAFRAVHRPDLRLIIAGETLSDALRQEIVDGIGGAASIDFHPRFLADEDVQYYMSAADVVVFPYTKALTSGALILAMSFGRACIAPAMGALRDTLDADGGFLFDPADPDGLRNALLAAIARRPALAAMGAHNFLRARQWDWNEAARRTAAAYDACLQRSR